MRVAMIGFGEAALAFAPTLVGRLVAFDNKVQIDGARQNKLDEIATTKVEVAETSSAATREARLILSLVTADAALAAAVETSATIEPGALYCDMNSVSPDTKRAAARAVEGAGGRYLDVAVMAPVLPGGTAVPVIVAGPHAEQGRAMLAASGFSNATIVGGAIGAASAIKMIRSVMVKGIEALSAECAIAANAAGVLDEVVASLDASWPGAEWRRRLDYNLDRMMLHGVRRAAEMQESAATLAALGVDPTMTRGTIERQRALGALAITPPEGLGAKLAALEASATNYRGTQPA